MSKIGVSVQWKINEIKMDREKREIGRRGGIYAIVNTQNGNRYVGQTYWFKKRWIQHLQLLRRGAHHNPHLQNSFNIYGESSFKFVVLEIVSNITRLTEMEQKWIDELKPEYNIIIDVTEGFSHALRNSFPVGFDVYQIPGESFIRPAWHRWVYGNEKNPVLTPHYRTANRSIPRLQPG